MGRALGPVEQAIGHWRSFQAARTAWRRLSELKQAFPSTVPTIALPKPKGTISIEQLVCVPPGARVAALKSITFNIGAGEQLAIIGHSGAGKSTLAKALVGAWQPVSGIIRLDGAALRDYDHEVLGSYVGYLPQEVDLLEGTISDNISRFSSPRNDAEIIRAAQQADAHDLILRLPDGYETRITDFGRSLSGGERQRIALARALYGKPSIVVLDEPAANLDRDGELALMRALSSAREMGMTTVMIAHRPSLVEQADRVLVLEEGRIMAFGTRNDVFAQLFPRGIVHSLQGNSLEPQALKG
jgi:PrtD family type I secretion system ABC transporter